MAEVGIEERMARIEGAFEQIDKRLGRLEMEVSQIRQEISALRSEFTSRFDRMIYWLLAMWLTIIGAILGTALTR